MTAARLPVGTENALPSRTGGGVHGADRDVWRQAECGAGTSLGLSAGCRAARKGTSSSTSKDVPKVLSLS